MDSRRGFGVLRAISTLIATILLTLALATPVLGGGLDCQLQATVGGGSATEVEPGEEVLVEGTGFPPDAEVLITYSVDGTEIGDETVTADGTGFFETTVIPQPGEEGLWTVFADVAKECTAETGFLVVAGAATPSPTAAPTPQGELPDVATSVPRHPSTALLGGLLVIATVGWLLSRTRLARLLR